MRKLDLDVFSKGMGLLSRTFDVPEPSGEVLKFWYALLSDLQDDVFISAVIDLCRNLEGLPPRTNIPALIRSRAFELNNRRRPTPEEAWAEVRREISSKGHSSSPEFSDPLVKRAVDTIGWYDICVTPESDISAVRGHFFRVYSSLLEKERREEELAFGESAHEALADLIRRMLGNKGLANGNKKRDAKGKVPGLPSRNLEKEGKRK